MKKFLLVSLAVLFMTIITGRPVYSKEYKAREWMKCKKSEWYYLTTYAYTLDNEKTENNIQPFPQWRYLWDLLCELQQSYDNFIEKSRRMVVTWEIMGHFEYNLTFKDNYPMFTMSRKEHLVDNKTPDSLLGKVKFIYQHKPEWLQLDCEFPYLKAISPHRGSYIIGESANDDAGRGGGYAEGAWDEVAATPRSEIINPAFDRACKKKILNSTPPLRRGGLFYRLKKDPNKSYVEISLHWKRRPDRDQAYYEKETRNLPPYQVAAEFDLSYEGATQGLVWPAFKYGEHVVKNLYDKKQPVELSFDFGYQDTTFVSFWQAIIDELWGVRDYEKNLLAVEQHAENLTNIMVSLDQFKPTTLKYFALQKQIRELQEEIRKERNRIGGPGQTNAKIKGMQSKENGLKDSAEAELENVVKPAWRKVRCCGDPAGRARAQKDGISLTTEYAKFGIHIKTKEKADVEYAIRNGTSRLNNKKMFVDAEAKRLIEIFQSYHYPSDASGNIKTGEIPDHDEFSHGGASIRYKIEDRPYKPVQKAKKKKIPTTHFKPGMFQG